MAEQRLPRVNGDDGQWGDILNTFVSKEHFNDDTDNTTYDGGNGSHRWITVKASDYSTPGTATHAPLKFKSGPLLASPVVGSLEFLTDKLYFTQTTGTTRNTVATYDDNSGATGDLYYRNSSGVFSRLPIGASNGQMLTVNSGVPAWSTVLSGASKVTVGTVQPSTPSVGDLWIDTN